MKTIKQDGHSRLVEYQENGKTHRVILPLDEENVNLGIPYGFPFAEMLRGHICEPVAERIENELHKVGIWTGEELIKKPQAAQGAVLAAYGVDLSILIQLARQFQGGK